MIKIDKKLLAYIALFVIFTQLLLSYYLSSSFNLSKSFGSFDQDVIANIENDSEFSEIAGILGADFENNLQAFNDPYNSLEIDVRQSFDLLAVFGPGAIFGYLFGQVTLATFNLYMLILAVLFGAVLFFMLKKLNNLKFDILIYGSSFSGMLTILLALGTKFFLEPAAAGLQESGAVIALIVSGNFVAEIIFGVVFLGIAFYFHSKMQKLGVSSSKSESKQFAVNSLKLESRQSTASSSLSCPSCGAPYLKGDMFCQKCGYKIR